MVQATVVRRSLAVFIDACLFLALFATLGATQIDFPLGYAFAGFVVVDLVLTAFFGRSVGRLLTGVRVALPDGRPPGPLRALLRTALVVTTGVAGPFVVALGTLGESDSPRMWWDRAAGTQVVMSPTVRSAEADRIRPNVTAAIAICVVSGVCVTGFLAWVAVEGSNFILAAISLAIAIATVALSSVLVRYGRNACIYVTPEEVGRIGVSGKAIEVWRRTELMGVDLYTGAMEWQAMRGGTSRVGDVLVVTNRDGSDAFRLSTWIWSRGDMEKLARLLDLPLRVTDGLAPPVKPDAGERSR